MFERRPDREGRGATSPTSVASALVATLVMLALVGVTATEVRRARLPDPRTREAREEVVMVVPPDETPVAPPPVVSPVSPRAAPSARTPVSAAPPVAPPLRAPAARTDSGSTRAGAPNDADVFRRGLGARAASAQSAACATLGLLTASDRARRALLGCPPPSAAAVRAARDSATLAARRELAGAMRVTLPLSQAEKDSLGRLAAIGASSVPTGLVHTPPLGAGGSFNIGLPGGGPSNAQRKRDRILNAEVSARLERIRIAGEARAKARADSARADSARRATP